MAKGLLGGMTDYSHQSFSDILTDLDNEQKRITSFREAIQSNIEILENNKYWREEVPSNFKDCINYALRHYNTSIDEFDDIKKDLLIEVKEHHIKRLEKIAIVAQEINVRIGEIWHRDYYGKDYGNPNFRLVEDIYGDTRDMAVNLLDISNIAGRLTDFLGKRTIRETGPDKEVKKSNKFLKVLSSGWGIGVVVAVLVMLFGNNWFFRVWDYFFFIPDKTTISTPIKGLDISIDTLELPYLDNVPIIDKTLFVKYYFNDLVIGGANVDSISINARAKNGDKLMLYKSNNGVTVDITREPYLEIKMNNEYYSFEVIGEHHNFRGILKATVKPTLILQQIKNINN